MKWIKRLFVAGLLLAALFLMAGVVLHRLAKSRPAWFPKRLMDAAALDAASHSAEDKLLTALNWAGTSNANERNRRNGLAPGAPGYIPAPDPVMHLSLTEAELNALLSKWGDKFQWKEKFSGYFEDPVIAVLDNRIILGGNVKAMDMVVSAHFQPELDAAGQLKLRLVSVMGGQLPLPKALWSGYRDRLAAKLAEKLQATQQGAGLASDGSMNRDAVAAEMDKLLLHALEDESADPILFLNHDTSHLDNGFPIRLTSIKIVDQTIDLDFKPLTPEERQTVLAKIREPYRGAAAAETVE